MADDEEKKEITPEIIAEIENYERQAKEFEELRTTQCRRFYLRSTWSDPEPVDVTDQIEDKLDAYHNQRDTYVVVPIESDECEEIRLKASEALDKASALRKEYDYYDDSHGGGSGEGSEGGEGSGEGESGSGDPVQEFKSGVLADYGITSLAELTLPPGVTEDDIFEAEAFWILHDPDFENDFLQYLNDCKTELDNCVQTENEIKAEVLKWLNMGTEFNMNLATIQNVNMSNQSDFNRDENLFDKMKEKKDIIGIFTKKMKKSIEVADKIKTAYPESYVGRQNLCYRDLVCNWMDMKGKSEEIYNNIKTALLRISDNVTEHDDSASEPKGFINYFNYYQKTFGNQDKCTFKKSQETSTENPIEVTDGSTTMKIGKKVEYCSEIINGVSTTDGKTVISVPDASGYRSEVLTRMACTYQNCPKQGSPN